jgi:transposase InsO family protein
MPPLVTNALGMAIKGRDPDRTVIHNNRRRHSSLNMLTPTEFEELHQKKSS